MAISRKLAYASVEDLFLDPQNPRLGRHNVEKKLSQAEILDYMDQFTLDELAVSFLESGFWSQEALIAVEEKVGKATRLVVVEGNRRLATLKLLDKAASGAKVSSEWKELVRDVPKSRITELLSDIPYLKADSRDDVAAFLGFRHVTGIKQWNPAEKAEYIAKLVDSGMDYRTVMRKIGSKVPAVRQNYISYRLLLQMEDEEEIDIKSVEKKFSVLFLSLRSSGVQTYLDINIKADPKAAKTPVPPDKLDHLIKFSLWLFGHEPKKIKPIITDSRDVDEFAALLTDDRAREYLERTPEPKFEVARRLAGVAEAAVEELILRAADNIQEALGQVHHHTGSKKVQGAVRRFGKDAVELLKKFPEIRAALLEQ